jgi:N,N'-diacetyllegionaminate synthase
MSPEKLWERIESGTFIIAEIGKGFIQTEEDQSVEVYLENAKKLALAAKETGVDAVKFQTHNVEDEQLDINVTSEHFKGSDRYSWVKRNTNATPLNEFWKPLAQYCREIGITFFSTPMSRGAAEIVDQLDTSLWKIGSGDILDFVLLDYLRNSGKPIIISSGMSTLEEVEKAVNFILEKNPRVSLLHCVSKYPCPPEELQLNTMKLFQEKFPNLPIGFSDHSLSNEPDLVAVAMGAKVLEKHFSFSRELWGSDHKVSYTPDELSVLVKEVRELENDEQKKQELLSRPESQAYLGEAGKILQEGEAKFRPLFRKSLMAARDLAAGTVLAPEDLYAMRPQAYAGGLPSEHYPEILGKKNGRTIKKYDPITEDLLQ